MNKITKKIFICATEQSGDNIGSNIINEILKLNKDVIFEGIGGSKMSPLMNNQFYSLSDFNKMGIIEIFFSLKKYYKIITFLVNRIINTDYDLIITIDSPDFNYPFIKKLRKNKYNKKIIHVVAPTVWAWRSYRAKTFSNVYDEIFLLFKFEENLFKKFNIKTFLIGHPVYYTKKNKHYLLDKKYIAFLPGSRISEFNKLMPYFKNAYEYLLRNFSDSIIVIPTLPHLQTNIENYVSTWKLKVIVTSNLDEIENYYQNISRALVCSGTASLEIAKRNIPQLVIYKLNFFTQLILKFFIKVKFANLINIFENKLIIPEIVNSKLNNKSFLKGFESLMNDDELNHNQIKNINIALKNFESHSPPYVLAANRIILYLS